MHKIVYEYKPVYIPVYACRDLKKKKSSVTANQTSAAGRRTPGVCRRAAGAFPRQYQRKAPRNPGSPTSQM